MLVKALVGQFPLADAQFRENDFATNADGTWFALDGKWAEPVGTTTVMCGWIKAADATALEPALPLIASSTVTFSDGSAVLLHVA